MSQFVTKEVEDQVKSSRIAKHVVMRTILKDYIDADENTINELLLRIYQLFYDSSMVDSIFSDIQERERQKQALQEMDLEDIASMAFSENLGGEAVDEVLDTSTLLELDEVTFQSLEEIGNSIPYEKIYETLKEANINIVIDFFSALQGSTSSLWEVTSKITEVEKKRILDIFSLFVEKQIEGTKFDEKELGDNLGSSVLNINVDSGQSFSIFTYTPAKWLDKGQMHHLSLGLMIQDEWAKYVSIMSKYISKKLNEIINTILGTTGEDLSNIPFRLVDLNIRKELRNQVKGIAEYISRCSLAWNQIQSSFTI
ncbi:MAG: hypothetical protein ACFE8U_18445 [Candidatus Hermodarchaeota archaeon]